MNGPRGSQAYDEVAYPTHPHPATHPDRLALLGLLHGLDAADPGKATFVDLACGDAGNLLAVAAALPEVRCVGVDASEAAIERGCRLRDASGLDRVELHCADLREQNLAGRIGLADFVAIHGLLSWVDAEVYEAALALGARLLTPTGVLLVSYNALPGWHLLEPARALARRHAGRGSHTPEEQAEIARGAVRSALELHAADDAYGHALALAVDRYEHHDPSLLHFDDLAETSKPFHLTEVVDVAERHGFAYLEEALPDQWWRWRLGPSSQKLLRRAAGDNPVSLQQEADFASGALFKASAFVRQDARPAPEMQLDRVPDLHAVAASDAHSSQPGEAPAVAAAATELEATAPHAIKVDELARRAGLRTETAVGAVLRLMAERRALLHVRAPAFAYPAGSHPTASPLARTQAAQGMRIASLRHESVEFNEVLGRSLLQLLDGTRDRETLAAELAARATELSEASVQPAQVATALDRYLDEVARLALLIQGSE